MVTLWWWTPELAAQGEGSTRTGSKILVLGVTGVPSRRRHREVSDVGCEVRCFRWQTLDLDGPK